MGMSTHVTGFKPPDKKWQEMEKIYDACDSASIAVPEEVCEYFGYEAPDEAGVEVEIKCREYHTLGKDGYEINMGDIPKDVKTIRFYNSY